MNETKKTENSRIFHICTELVNPNTYESIIDEDRLKFTLSRYNSIKEWAYILHDKDTYIDEDETNNPPHKKGNFKPPHFHIVIKTTNSFNPNVISKWFGVPSNFIHKVWGGEKGITDMLVYFTHKDEKQRRLEKAEYSIESIKSNFDVKSRINDYLENHDKEWFNLSPSDKILYKITYEGMTLKDAEKENRPVYMKKRDIFKKARLDYLNTRSPLPETRFNFYIYGEGGVGKDFMAKALARTLYPEIKDDEDIFFQVGSSNTTFEGYDGQPVIIWNDIRSSTLLNTFKERGDIFNAIDVYPKKIRQNIKFGSVCLTNHINIFTGSYDYKDFLDGLVMNENINQSYRRFPIVLPVRDKEFDILISDWFYNSGGKINYGHFKDYIEYKKICADITFISEYPDKEKRDKYTNMALFHIIEKYKEGLDILTKTRNISIEEYEKTIMEMGFFKEKSLSDLSEGKL